MAEEKASGYCARCDKRVMITRPGTNHILHLLLTLITAGLWLIVWIGCAVKFGGWRCTICGKPTGRVGSPSNPGTVNAQRKCPYCAEMIHAEAKKCKHCQSEVTPAMTEQDIAKAHSEAKKDSLVGWSVIAVIGVVVIILWNVFF